MEKNFNEQESLQLIHEMIAQAKNNLKKGDAFSYLLIGYSLVATLLLSAVLVHVLTPGWYAHWAWLIMVPVFFYTFCKGRRENRKATVRTHIEAIITGVWNAFMIALGIVFILLFGFARLLDWQLMLLATPVTLAMTGLAQYATAAACRYKPFYRAAVVFWTGALACLPYCYFMQEASGLYLISAVCFVAGFIVPGHLLNRKAERHV